MSATFNFYKVNTNKKNILLECLEKRYELDISRQQWKLFKGR